MCNGTNPPHEPYYKSTRAAVVSVWKIFEGLD